MLQEELDISKKSLVLFIKYNLCRLNKISFKVRYDNNATTSWQSATRI